MKTNGRTSKTIPIARFNLLVSHAKDPITSISNRIDNGLNILSEPLALSKGLFVPEISTFT